jgi:carbonic anhydrase
VVLLVQTTPPCAEGLRWHVFTNYIPVSFETVEMYDALLANITDRETGVKPLSAFLLAPMRVAGRGLPH